MVNAMAIRETLSKESEKRFWEKVDKSGNCWNWKAAKNESGYGIFGVGKNTDRAHRISWTLTRGIIEHGKWVLHKCDNPPCVNPEHLFLGSARDNHIDMTSKGRGSSPPPMGGWNKLSIPDSVVSSLGRISDAEIGRSLGVSKSVIRRFRNSKGILPLPNQMRLV